MDSSTAQFVLPSLLGLAGVIGTSVMAFRSAKGTSERAELSQVRENTRTDLLSCEVELDRVKSDLADKTMECMLLTAELARCEKFDQHLRIVSVVQATKKKRGD